MKLTLADASLFSGDGGNNSNRGGLVAGKKSYGFLRRKITDSRIPRDGWAVPSPREHTSSALAAQQTSIR